MAQAQLQKQIKRMEGTHSLHPSETALPHIILIMVF